MSDHETGKAYDQNAPAFTEDDVAGDFAGAIDTEVVSCIGYASAGLLQYQWAEQDGTWPFTVVRDGRQFEVDIDVCVTELTPESLAPDVKSVDEQMWGPQS